MKIRALAMVMVCALLLPTLALAEAPDAQQGGFRMQTRSQMGRYNVDRAQLSDEQKQAYDKALSDYAAAEDQALKDLVAAGDVAQEEADRFTRTRDQQGAMASLEMNSWTSEQQQAFQAAMTAAGDERAAAFAALVSSGLLTQAQADAFSNMNASVNRRNVAEQDGSGLPDGSAPPDGAQFTREGNPPEGQAAQRQGRSFDIWTEIQSRDQTESIQHALGTIQAAQQAFVEALSNAGIEMMN